MRTFNEGEELRNGKTKQDIIMPNDGEPVGIAVIWQMELRADLRYYFFVIVTVPPNQLIGTITDRMQRFFNNLIGLPGWVRKRSRSTN